MKKILVLPLLFVVNAFSQEMETQIKIIKSNEKIFHVEVEYTADKKKKFGKLGLLKTEENLKNELKTNICLTNYTKKEMENGRIFVVEYYTNKEKVKITSEKIKCKV